MSMLCQISKDMTLSIVWTYSMCCIENYFIHVGGKYRFIGLQLHNSTNFSAVLNCELSRMNHIPYLNLISPPSQPENQCQVKITHYQNYTFLPTLNGNKVLQTACHIISCFNNTIFTKKTVSPGSVKGLAVLCLICSTKIMEPRLILDTKSNSKWLVFYDCGWN